MNDALPSLTGNRNSPDRVEKRTVSKRRKLFLWLSISAFPLTLLAALVFRSGTSCHPDYQNSCINTLLQIEGAKEQWALENKLTNGSPASQKEVAEYIKGGWPTCAEGGSYIIGSVGEPARCTLHHKR
jgi:hypothetical protein